MTNTQHTPGPWHNGHYVDKNGNISDANMTAVYDNNNRTICETWLHANLAEAEANARLIAAAPETHNELVNSNGTLHDILQRVVLPKDVVDDILAQIFRNDAAIAKAKGAA